MCYAPNVYMFVYTLIGAHIVHLIKPCGVQLDSRPRFTICTYQNETDCCIYFTYHTWHRLLDMKWTRIRKVPLQHPSTTFLPYKQKIKLPSETNEQDIQYPITSLIFVIESQFLCLYPCFQGQVSQFLHLTRDVCKTLTSRPFSMKHLPRSSPYLVHDETKSFVSIPSTHPVHDETKSFGSTPLPHPLDTTAKI